MQRMRTLVTAAAAALVVGSLTATASASPTKPDHGGPTVIGGYKHLVVIYEENHSFDNLYGTGVRSTASTSKGWPTPSR